MINTPTNKDEKFITPRSPGNSSFLFGVITSPVMFTLLSFYNFLKTKSLDLYLAIPFSIAALIFVIPLYFVEKYRIRLIIDRDNGIMKKVKKGKPIINYDLNNIKHLTIQRI